MRLSRIAVGGGVLALTAGAAGLIAAALPQSSGAGAPASPGAVTVSGAYVHPPIPPAKDAVAYFTVDNTTDRPDRITDVLTGAGATAQMHSADMRHMTGAVVPAHGSLVLRPGGMHVMIGGLYDRLAAGQDVNIEVDLARAGAVDVVAKVVPYGVTPPGSGGS